MAGGHSVGTIFVELDLDASRYMRGQQQLLKDATSTTLNIEKNFKNLGIKSSAEFDLLRQKAMNAFERIKHSSQATANDILRAEKAKNEQLRKLNEQQFGSQKSLLQGLKDNWLVTTGAIVAAWYSVQKVVNIVKGITLDAARYETLGVAMNSVGRNAGYTADEMARFQKGLESTGISMSGSRQALTRMAQAQLDLAQSAKLARVAQDAAVIGAMNSTEAFNTMVYGIQSANVRVLRTIGINVSWEESYKKVAEQLGRTTTSFSESEKASIRLNAVLEAGQRISGTYEAAMETAGKRLYSLERHFDNLKVQVGEAFLPLLGELVTATEDFIKSLTPEDIKFMADSIKILTDAFIGLSKVLFAIPSFMKNVATSMQTEVTVLNEALSTINKFEEVAAKRYPIGPGTPGYDIYKSKPDTSQTAAKETNKIIESEKKAAEEAKKINDKLWQYKVDAAVKADKEMADAYALYATYEQDMAKKTIKVTAEEAKAKIDLQKTLVDSLTRTDKRYFEYKWQALKDEKQKYLDLGFSKTQVEEAFAARAKDLYREQTLAHGNMIDGMIVGLEVYLENQRTWADQGLELFNTFTNAVTSSLSDSFYAVIKGTGGLDEIWKSFLDSMLKAFTDMLAEMIVQWTMSGLLNLFTGKGLSGFTLESLVGGTALGDALGIGGAAAGVAGGIGGAAAVGGVGATATVAGGTAFEAYAGTGGAATTATTAGGYAALGPVSAAILAAPVLGPTMTSAWKSLITGVFGVGEQTAPSARNYLDAMNAGLDYVPGWEDMTTGFLSAALSRGGAEELIRSLLKDAGYLFSAAEHALWDPEGTFMPAYTDPGAGPYAELLKKYKGLKTGIDFVPADGPYYLHKGERVTSAENNKEQTLTVNVPIYIDGKMIGYVVADQLGTNIELINATRKAVH